MGRFTAENAEMGKLLLRGFDDIMGSTWQEQGFTLILRQAQDKL